MPKYFGTDGIRAVAGQFPLVRDFIEKLGYCALKEIEKQKGAAAQNRAVIIAQDSRASGPEILKSLTRGIRAAGFNVISVGIAPTPAAAYLANTEKAACGAVISASHNPAEFNGIKFFSPDGKKLSEPLESAIEEAIENTKNIPPEQEDTFFKEDETLLDKYCAFLKSVVPADVDLKGLKAVLDCANGAAYKIAPKVFTGLGMQPVVIFDKPTGLNINDGAGALHTQKMQQAVKEQGAFIGFSFDGDADRLIAADEQGAQMDGDDIISACALAMKAQNALKQNKVALTVMANLGLVNFLKENGIEPVLTAVGDKYVFEALEKENLSLGGETSGHIIFKDISPAGDGILSALILLSVIKKSGRPASWFKTRWSKYPLKLIPVKVKNKTPLDKVPGLNDFIKNLQAQMGAKGRIFVRYSGTEPLLRILVEGENKEQVENFAEQTKNYYLQHNGENL